jgi:tripartite-type tricarboxylate transporter receptor subunit TctC
MGWNWWLVKPGTPKDRVETLREAMGTALADPEVRERILQIGFVPTDYAPEQFTEVCNDLRDQLTSAMDAIIWEKEALAESRLRTAPRA